MKITSVKTYLVAHKLPTWLANSYFEYRSREALLIKISTDEGVVGWGETAPMAGVREIIDKKFAPLIIGEDPRNHRQLWRKCWGVNFGNGMAMGGLDIALHDLRGKILNQSISDMYGGRVRDRVEAYASSVNYREGCEPEDQYPADALDLVRQGFRGVKLRIGRFSLGREIPIIAAVRDALGPGIKLTVDVNGAYSLPRAIRMGRELEQLGIDWYEEPLPQHQYVGYDVLSANLDIPIAGGECVDSRAAAQALLARRAVDIIQPDVSLCGGFAECLGIAEMSRMWNILCIPHCWGGAIVTAATIHLVSLLSAATSAHDAEAPLLELDVTENPFRDQIVTRPFQLCEGFVDVPTGPGLGIEIDESVVESYSVH
ncbi:mandelate racemase/muconate lactonizing enzyme family protein [Schlesneria paludicola]|uniref:mandelate racemase/muconate lactonizing enzyme family protein n=1 Tax=Schlesneria paludicola TaxID=360056 RepID=UPI00029A5F09|nr:mandelate racemase/muconate lactonizing enzyme family protein [Schlesneria paludicola]